MAKELDTSWFDLRNYEPLKEMSIEGWASVLGSRAYIDELYDCQQKGEDYEWTLQAIADELKQGDFSTDVYVESYLEDYALEVSERHSFSTPTIDSLSNYQAWEMSKHGLSGHELDKWQKMQDEWQKPFEDNESRNELIKVARAPYDFYFKQYLNSSHIPSFAHLVISLYAPNEQIKDDFAHWLTHYRKVSGYHVPKKKIHEKRFNQKTFDYWIEYGLIPYLDLTLSACFKSPGHLHKPLFLAE